MANEKKGFIQEFKEFINQGNAMDMAVGVVIGGAFTAIVNSLVTSIINPLITLLSGGTVGEDGVAIGGLVVPGTAIDFGAFIAACLNFLIIAFVVFCLVKGLNSMKSKMSREKETEPEAVEEAPSEDIVLLREIRDALASK